MSYEPKNLLGALFKNDKEGNEHRPDYKGDCCINGVEYQIGAWLKDGKKGKFLSLKFEAKKRQDVSGEVPATSASGPRTKTPTREPAKPEQYSGGIRQPAGDQFDDDIPF